MGISRGSVHSILTEGLCMQRVSAKFIPKLLTEQQKELHVEIAQDMLDCANNDLEFTKTQLTHCQSYCDTSTRLLLPQKNWFHTSVMLQMAQEHGGLYSLQVALRSSLNPE